MARLNNREIVQLDGHVLDLIRNSDFYVPRVHIENRLAGWGATTGQVDHSIRRLKDRGLIRLLPRRGWVAVRLEQVAPVPASPSVILIPVGPAEVEVEHHD